MGKRKGNRRSIFLLSFCLIATTILVGLYVFGPAIVSADEDFEFKWLLPYEYRDGNPFSEGRAWVQKEFMGPWTLFDEKGNIIKDGIIAYFIFEYDNGLALCVGRFTEPRLPFSFLDISGDLVLSPVEWVSSYSGGLIHTRQNEKRKSGVMDINGTWVISPDYNIVLPNFSEGMTLVRSSDKYGFIDKRGNLVIDYMLDYPTILHNGVIVGNVGSLYGLLNKQGDWITEPIYEAFFYPWSSNLIGFQKDGKVGFVDHGGNIVIDFQFPSVSGKKGFTADWYCFSDGLATVFLDEETKESGIINESGDIIYRRTGGYLRPIFKGSYRGYFFSYEEDGHILFWDRNGRSFPLEGVYPISVLVHPSDSDIFMIKDDGKSRVGYFTLNIKGVKTDAK